MTGDRDRCLAAGMDDYLSKPLQLDELTIMLAKWLSPASAAGDRAKLPDAAPTEKEEQDESVLRRCSGNRALAARLLRKFVAQSADDMDVIARASAGKDHERVAQVAHRLKGTSGNLGLKAISRLAAELEICGTEGSAGDATELLKDLRRELAMVAQMPILLEAVTEKA
jgi:HPt (histidine-containing phosphotransfer) domain-containing protein